MITRHRRANDHAVQIPRDYFLGAMIKPWGWLKGPAKQH
jgi:hypothetical protein